MTRWNWRRLLELAELGGWRPVDSDVRIMLAEHRLLRHASAFPGSEPPVPHPWCNREIPLRDARSLASSLRDALLDVPHHDSVEAKAPAVCSRAGTVRERMIAPGDTVSPGLLLPLVNLAAKTQHGDVCLPRRWPFPRGWPGNRFPR